MKCSRTFYGMHVSMTRWSGDFYKLIFTTTITYNRVGSFEPGTYCKLSSTQLFGLLHHCCYLSEFLQLSRIYSIIIPYPLSIIEARDEIGLEGPVRKRLHGAYTLTGFVVQRERIEGLEVFCRSFLPRNDISQKAFHGPQVFRLVEIKDI